MKRFITFVLLCALMLGIAPPLSVQAGPALPLQSLEIIDVYLSDYAYAETLPGPGLDQWWRYPLTASGTNVSRNLPNEKRYIRIDYKQMGNLVGRQSNTLDGRAPVTSNVLHALDEDGNIINYGMAYGFIMYDVFEINRNANQSKYNVKLMDNRAPLYKTLEANLSITWYGNSPAGSPPVSVIYNSETFPDYAVAVDTDTTMEYQLTGSGWTTCSAIQVPLEVSDKLFWVRYAQTDTESASPAKIIQLIPRGPIPSGMSLNRTTGIITGLTEDMEMRLDGQIYRTIPEEILLNGVLSIIQGLEYGETVRISFRYKATEDKPAGLWGGWTLTDQSPAAPAVSYDPYNNHSVSPITSAMQYRYDGGPWYSLTGTGSYSLSVYSRMSSQKTVEFEVRYKATGTQPASQIKKITLPKLSPAPSGVGLGYKDGKYSFYYVKPNVWYQHSTSPSFTGSTTRTTRTATTTLPCDFPLSYGDKIYLRTGTPLSSVPSACVEFSAWINTSTSTIIDGKGSSMDLFEGNSMEDNVSLDPAEGAISEQELGEFAELIEIEDSYAESGESSIKTEEQLIEMPTLDEDN
ncbi:hypothetical protein DesLBE_3294 [Desulfitobacterium sp. LBE]|uniref:hypothetical protein n=1 Tax=Desulfitobacterium sp. LBE TaxID=884086 RepID=UPI00119C4983|nr:hypothetical protein [Desulfitobacterium sp. LBE]TWH58936.1 hypothetical protein DesLBE_3294 [Desulfitobacterium sp. LBE]